MCDDEVKLKLDEALQWWWWHDDGVIESYATCFNYRKGCIDVFENENWDILEWSYMTQIQISFRNRIYTSLWHRNETLSSQVSRMMSSKFNWINWRSRKKGHKISQCFDCFGLESNDWHLQGEKLTFYMITQKKPTKIERHSKIYVSNFRRADSNIFPLL